MIPISTMSGRNVAVFGLGGSGLATVQALRAGGAQVAAWDDQEGSRIKAAAAGVPLVDLSDADWSRFAALVLAPGVPLTHPRPHWTVEKAKAAGIEIIGDVELFCRERRASAPDAPFVAITGTNGKSTTTALVGHVLREGGLSVEMGGNIGTAILSLQPPGAGRVHVIEMSSFQIDLTPSLDASVGVLMNITPDHLDRHGTMENYAGIKERLVAGARLAIVGVDDDFTRAIARRRAESGGLLKRFSAEGPLPEGYFAAHRARDGVLETYIACVADGKPRLVASLAGIASLRGQHNAQNAAAACAVAHALGLADATIAAALRTFPGLAHRMEEVGRRGSVLFVNDSKATNADSAEKALTSFSDIFWILGGKAKEGGIESLRRHFGKVTKAYLIGAATDEFAATLEGAVPFARCGTLEVAVAQAAADAAAHAVAMPGATSGTGPVVLFSPACASYDQFPNFEVRGDRFRTLVTALPGA